MKNKNRGRRGMTVSELMVVLAVLTIVIVMVVSFSTMVGSTSKLAKAKLDALNDIKLAESVIENFIEDNSGQITILSEGKIGNTAGENISFSNGYLIVSRTGGNGTTIEMETVNSIKFSMNENASDTLYYCTITYAIGDSDFDYTFCVNPYAGEQIN